jgi:hypothetical protein
MTEDFTYVRIKWPLWRPATEPNAWIGVCRVIGRRSHLLLIEHPAGLLLDNADDIEKYSGKRVISINVGACENAFRGTLW